MKKTLVDINYIFKDVEADTFETLIKKMSEPLINDHRVSEEFPYKVCEREQIFPTGLPTEPYGVAIPHTDPEYVLENTISIAVLKQPLEMVVMGSDQEKVMVSIIFLLSLGESNKQLNILKQLMKGFQDESILTAFMKGTKEEIYQIAKENMSL